MLFKPSEQSSLLLNLGTSWMWVDGLLPASNKALRGGIPACSESAAR